MAQPYVGEIRMFAGNFAPAGWMFCNGTLIPISENETLFQLIGTTYGGDGQVEFALPDLRARVPLHMGTGSTGTIYGIAASGGVEAVTLTTNDLPSHTHTLRGSENAASSTTPAGSVYGEGVKRVYRTPGTTQAMAAQAVGPTGGSQPHTNHQKSLGINFIISLFGLFPSPT